MLTVNKSDVTLVEGTSRLATEASTIGLRPGEAWPEFIAVTDDRGSGFLFQRGTPILHGEGEIGGYEYFDRANPAIVLSVFND